MTRQLISSGSEYEAKFGYSRAVVDGDWVFVSGTTGFDYASGEISDGPSDIAHDLRCIKRRGGARCKMWFERAITCPT